MAEKFESSINAEMFDNIFRQAGMGGWETTKLDLFYGLDITGAGLPLEPIRDGNAYVFFTRPTMNMSTSNIAGLRKLHYLANQDPTSIGGAVRCTLMPYMYRSEQGSLAIPRSYLIDENNPFIPLLSNTIRTISGWPDKVADFYNSAEGLGKEVYSYADGNPEFYESFDLTVTFSNKRDDYVNALLTAWVYYQLAVSKNWAMALPEMRAKRRVDYQTRPYILIMDETNTFVQKVCCAGVAMWGASTEGSSFNIDKSNAMIMDTNDISVPLKCNGARYNDPIVIYNFNTLVEKFNPTLLTSYKKLSQDEHALFGFRAIPHIDVKDGHRLNWYVTQELYTYMKNKYKV